MVARLIILACILMSPGSAANSAAQSQPSPTQTESSPPAGARTIEAKLSPDVLTGGTFLLAEFAGSVNARKLKTGDRVKAHVVQDVLSHGRIVVPEGASLVGHITEVALRSKGQPESSLGIVFDKAELKHHKELLFQAVVVALAAPAQRHSRVDEPDRMIPAAMVGGPGQGTSMTGHGANRPSTVDRNASSSLAALTLTPPGTIQNDSSHPATAGYGEARPETRPMSAGMFGVRGIKNISLSQRSGGDTPGPIIVSNTNDVKLEDATQVILRINGVAATQ
jgi:hypothetical protein